VHISFTPDYQPQIVDPHCGAVPLTQTSAATLLMAMIRNVSGLRLVFDLDSTLLNNRPRNAQIMCEYGALHNEPALSRADASHFVNWDTRHSMTLAGLDEALITTHIDNYEDFWLQRFFTGEYCQYDIAVSGAVTFVGEIAQRGGTVCYLTGRDESMRAGRQASLEKLGFPVPGHTGVTLVMKTERGEADDKFKHEAMAQLVDTGGIAAAFDNEPTHINSYRQTFPAAVCVHLFTDHSMRQVPLLDGIYSINNFLCGLAPDE
jgi:hypothetical protein